MVLKIKLQLWPRVETHNQYAMSAAMRLCFALDGLRLLRLLRHIPEIRLICRRSPSGCSCIEPEFSMWDRPNQESMVRIGLICNQVASDGYRRANPVGRGPIGGRAGLKQAR
jgi:hypothetical protein